MPMIELSALVDGFYDPPHPAVNPAAAPAEDEAIKWLWRIGFLRTPEQEAHLRSFRFGLYHGIATPHVDLDHLRLGLAWFCWGSLADDQYDNYDWGDRDGRLRGVLRAFEAIMDGAVGVGDNPVIAGFADFWPRLTRDLTWRGRQRIGAHFMDYLHAIRFQNTFHATGQVPDMATFLMMRRNTIAMVFQADVLDVVSETRVPEAVWASAPHRELVWCFADITAWHNDVYGLEKDLADGQTCNMVRVVAAGEGCDLDEAVARVLDRAKRRQRLFLAIEAQIPDLVRELGLPAEVATRCAQHAKDLRAYAYANLIWLKQTRRYDLDRQRIRGTFDDVITADPVP
jgi:hypothetical protein